MIKGRHKFIFLFSMLFMLMACGRREVMVVKDRYPDNQLKMYKKLVTHRFIYQHTEKVFTWKRYWEYYANGKLKMKEKSKDRMRVWQMGEDPSRKSKIYHYNEDGNITNKLKKSEDESIVWEYKDGRLVSKKFISNGRVSQMDRENN